MQCAMKVEWEQGYLSTYVCIIPTYIINMLGEQKFVGGHKIHKSA